MKKVYLLNKKGKERYLYNKADSSHSFGMTNNAVISTEGRNLCPIPYSLGFLAALEMTVL